MVTPSLRRWEQDAAKAADEIAAAEAAKTAVTVEPVEDRTGDDVVVAPVRPSRSASAAVWRAYAEAVGVDHTGFTKGELIDQLS